MITKKQVIWKIHINDIHKNIINPGEYIMHATLNNPYFSIKVTLEVFKNCDTAKSNQKLLNKVTKEKELKTSKMIYLDIIPQKKPSCGGSMN